MHDHQNHGTKNIRWAFFVNLLFAVVEFFGGLFTNSLSIMSDALHDLGDSLSLGLAWYFENLSKKGRDSKFSYGYKRFSLLAAIVNSLILVVGSVVILHSAAHRLSNPEVVRVEGMFLLAILGIAFNAFAMWKLKHGHTYNEKVVSLHMLEDVLGWIAVLLGSLIIYFTGWLIVDPILSILITLFILYNVYKNLRKSLKIVLQGIPENIDISNVQSRLLGFLEIESIHDLHIWSLDGTRNILTVHLVLDKEMKPTELARLKNQVKLSMKNLGISHCTLEFEIQDEECALVDC